MVGGGWEASFCVLAAGAGGAPSQRVQGTYIVECRVSILGIAIMIWESIPHNTT